MGVIGMNGMVSVHNTLDIEIPLNQLIVALTGEYIESDENIAVDNENFILKNYSVFPVSVYVLHIDGREGNEPNIVEHREKIIKHKLMREVQIELEINYMKIMVDEESYIGQANSGFDNREGVCREVKLTEANCDKTFNREYSGLFRYDMTLEFVLE